MGPVWKGARGAVRSSGQWVTGGAAGQAEGATQTRQSRGPRNTHEPRFRMSLTVLTEGDPATARAT